MSRVSSSLVPVFLASLLASAGLAAQTAVFQGSIQGPDGAVLAGPLPPRDLPPQRTGTSRIRGRVLLSDTGQPARRATVRVSGSDLREALSTVTDADGRYEVGGLPSGRYTVTASKSAYVTITYGQTRPMEPGRPLEIGDKQIVEKVDFSLPRGGVITGRVLDEYGEPVANAMVQPMQNRFVGGQQRPMASGQFATTPDTGEYRLWGLSPGQYFVFVNPRGTGAGFMDSSDDRGGYSPTYYPNTSNMAEAQPIAVLDGQTTTGVDLMLVATRTARVSGTAVDASGQPVRGGMVMAMSRSTTGIMSPQGGPIRADGTFAVSGLAPGEYTLRASVPPARPGSGRPDMLVATVTVAGADVTGVLLSPLQPVVVKGRIVFDPPTTSVQPSMFQVIARPRNPEPMFGLGSPDLPVINDDFTFELPTPGGQMVIGAMLRAPVSSGTPWVVKSVRHDSTDITDDGLDLVPGRDVDDVEIVLTSRVQTVSGLISNAQGQMVTDATVMIFAQNRERWGGTSRYQAMTRPDQNGRYSARTLPPGEYYAVAVQYVDPARRGGDPTYYEQFVADAASFTLREAETRALDLKLVIPR